MAHFSLNEWSDFVRGVAGASLVADMNPHLQSCPECQANVAWLKSVARTADAVDVPAEWTARAEAIFRPSSPDRSSWIASARRLAVELLRDSFRDPVPVGVRSAVSAGAGVRLLAYRAGDYDIAVRVGPESRDDRDITGQISHRLHHEQPLPGLLVQTVVAGRTVGETETNQFGEFLIDRPLQTRVTLRILLPEAVSVIEVLLSTPPVKRRK